MTYRIELTEREKVLEQQIEFDALKLEGDDLIVQSDAVLELLRSLLNRDALPEARKKYWTDPEYQNGRVKESHRGLFERSGCRGEDIYVHPHFLKYLEYFLYGAKLPKAVTSQFQEVVGDPRWVTSSDVTPITKSVRKLVREYGLQGEAEEFFRPALDSGPSLSFARAVRDGARQAGSRRNIR